jgi:hypothetical protein
VISICAECQELGPAKRRVPGMRCRAATVPPLVTSLHCPYFDGVGCQYSLLVMAVEYMPWFHYTVVARIFVRHHFSSLDSTVSFHILGILLYDNFHVFTSNIDHFAYCKID